MRERCSCLQTKVSSRGGVVAGEDCGNLLVFPLNLKYEVVDVSFRSWTKLGLILHCRNSVVAKTFHRGVRVIKLCRLLTSLSYPCFTCFKIRLTFVVTLQIP